MSISNISTYLPNTSVIGSQDTASPTLAYSYLLRVAFGLIAFLAFTENSLLCIVILRSHGMLRSAYNVLIFSLAVTDMLTGVFLVVTPNYLIALTSYQAPSGMLGVVFCKVIGSQCCVFLLGKVSCFIVMCLALERWYAVVKPVKYRMKFQRRRVCIYLLLVWLYCLAFHSSLLFGMTLDKDNLRCVWVSVDSPKELIVPAFTIATFFIPSAVTWTTYLHISLKLKASPASYSIRYSRARLRLLRMCVIVALLLTACWFPNQLYYTLSAYGLVKLESPFHHITIVLAMFNSCTNPVIYCYSNKEYRKGFLAILCPIFTCCHSGRQRATSYTLDRSRSEGRSGSFHPDQLADGVILSSRYINHGYEMKSII